MLIFCFSDVWICFFSGLEFLRRELIVPSAGKPGGSSVRMCLDRAYLGFMLAVTGGGCQNTNSVYGLGLGRLHAKCNVCGVERGLLDDA